MTTTVDFHSRRRRGLLVRTGSTSAHTACPVFKQGAAKKHAPLSAFTLLELLVAMAVMSLVMIAIVAITNGTASLAQGAQNRIGGNAELRTALDRLSADLDLALIRSDLPPISINPNSENATLDFHIAASGYSGDRPISNVRYEISSSPQGLVRSIQGFGWSQNPVPFGTTNSTISNVTPKDEIGARIFRFDCQFLLNNGTFSSNSSDIREAHALVVSLAAIDEQAVEKMKSSADELPKLARLFPSSSTNRSAFEEWTNLLQSPNFVSNNQSIPPAILAGIQVAGRIIPLPRQR
jgi:prepilin-type N-terminal cleavage/methylation domain-containing protein